MRYSTSHEIVVENDSMIAVRTGAGVNQVVLPLRVLPNFLTSSNVTGKCLEEAHSCNRRETDSQVIACHRPQYALKFCIHRDAH